MFLVEVDTTEFDEWVDEFRQIIHIFEKVLSNFAPLLEMNTKPYVPLDTGDLEDSYAWRLVVKNDSFIELDVGYSVITQNGFDYAIIQHDREDFYHPKRGESFYLWKGIRDSSNYFFELVESDYLSLFGV